MLAASACGSAGVKRLSPSPSAPDPKTKLLVTYWPHGDGAGGKLVWTLTCQPAGGDHPHAHVACAELGSRTDPFAPPNHPCAMVIRRGEPSAVVTGRYGDRAISLILRPGCGSTWQHLHVLLTGA